MAEMTIQEASKLLNISKGTVYALVKSGDLKARKCKCSSHKIFVDVPECFNCVLVPFVAKTIGVDPGCVRALCRDKRLKAKKIGKMWFVDKVDAEKLIKIRLGLK